MNANSLSKDIILLHTNSNAIYTTYLGLNDFPKGNISSPFATDKNPSFKVYPNGSFKCSSTGLQGDVWQFVANVIKKDCKTEFQYVLQDIAKTMNIPLQSNFQNKYSVKKTANASNTGVATTLQNNCSNGSNTFATEKTASKLSVEVREFTGLDLTYWKNLGVERTILEKYKVQSISSYTWTGKKPIYTRKESVAFAFELDGHFKLYIPNQPEIGIKKNVLPPFPNNKIFGLKQLGTEKVENLIICAGEKDVITANSRGFTAVTFGSESSHPKNEQIQLLQQHCDNLLICYDNDETGLSGRNKIVERFPKIVPLQLPTNDNIKGYDVTDYFQNHTAKDFQKIIDLAVKNKSVLEPTPEKELTTIIHVTEDYLNENYQIRHNIISNEIEISNKDANYWTDLNENTLWIEMQKKSIKVPASTLEKILKSDFVPKFNPFIEYFNALPSWDKVTDYITQYADYVKLSPDEDKDQYNYHFKKWCVRSVKCATIDNYFNKNAFVISDEGKGQNIGKTTWIRNLCPKALSNYIKDDLPKDEKDAKISLTQNFIVNLDELASLSRQEINTLKSLFSADKIKVRFPYDKKDSVVRRVANFIGSTNLSTFLHDETGSVRWLCFVADTIDFSYKNNFDMDKLWSQAFALSNDENFDETITSVDMSINEMRNAKFQIQSPEKDLICRYLEIPKTVEETKILTSTEIQHYLAGFANSIKLNNVTIGKALTSLKYRKIRSSITTKYAVKYKDSVE
ncbi:VapE domain-containing protein [Flavobacterium sp.]|jgi:predicted P-loop ATPase|uniref:VapE domain-containing protein n=1 Tax=Flavobacterium sp. TaxID=239 RepID=UPI0037C19170